MLNFFKYVSLISLTLVKLQTFAQRDSISYEQQREKINNMLTERSNRFSQYYESLDKRTGIFGLQTRQDIRNSNEILRSVVLHDNDIFRQLKTLLEYKDQRYEANLAVEKARGQQTDEYKAAVLRMQQANIKLKQIAGAAERRQAILTRFLVIAVALLAALAWFTFTKLKPKQLD